MCQKDNTYIEILNRIHTGEETEEDHDWLMDLVAPNWDETLQDGDEAPMFAGRRAVMHARNAHFLVHMPGPIVTFEPCEPLLMVTRGMCFHGQFQSPLVCVDT